MEGESDQYQILMDTQPDLALLTAARNGRHDVILELVNRHKHGNVHIDLNCKGEHKANKGWTPLHLASYFGHTNVVEALLENGADVNVLNDVGDTALHRASYTGRVEVVMLLLKFNADVSLINAEGHTAKDITKNSEIRNLVEAAECVENRRSEEEFLKAARNGNTDIISKLLKMNNAPNINCTDGFGNTALHCASYRGHKETAVFLLQNGIDSSIRNARGQTALDMSKNRKMKHLLDVKPIKELQKSAQRFEGPLIKITKVLGRYRPIWVVLDRGVMSFFKNRADASTGSRRKGCKYLDDAKVTSRRDTSNLFDVEFSDHTVITFGVEDNPSAQINRQKWENSLADHIAYGSYCTKQCTGAMENEVLEDMVPLGSMQDAMETAKAHQRLLEKQVSQANTSIKTFQTEADRTNIEYRNRVSLPQISQEFSEIMESAKEMSKSMQHCLVIFAQQEEIRKLQLEEERERCRVLQDALHILAEEHHHLEQSFGGQRSPSVMFEDSDNEDDEFYDCEAGASTQFFDQKSSEVLANSAGASNSLEDPTMQSTTSVPNGSTKTDNRVSKWGSRCQLPVPMFSRNEFSVWSILKHCIGKELSKITMPVIFNEPMSFLQRIVEYMEYANLLKLACASEDPVVRMEYVTAFAVSASASNWDRLGKPFNPLLGETYELEREDLGFKIACEQVSHHPPVSAFHVDSTGYTLHGAIHPKLKFWGKSVEINPKGTLTLYIKEYDETYTWQYVNCCVHNIIVGKLWIEHYGQMEIINHKTKHKAVVNFKPSGWFGKDLHKLEGYIYNNDKRKMKALYGKWVEGLYSYEPEVWENYLKTVRKTLTDSPAMLLKQPKVPDEPPPIGSTCNLNLDGQKCLWEAEERPDDAGQYYSFTHFAMMLNELNDQNSQSLPSTDSRLRPDIRKLEDGDLDGAAEEKHRLEEKQRAARKERKKKRDEWNPNWFKLQVNPVTGKEDWIFTNQYWNRVWDNCPDIF